MKVRELLGISLLAMLTMSLEAKDYVDQEKNKKISWPVFDVPSIFKNSHETFVIRMPSTVAGVRGKVDTKTIDETVTIHLEKSFFEQKVYWSPAKVICRIFKLVSPEKILMGEFELLWGENPVAMEYKEGERFIFEFEKNKDENRLKAVELEQIKELPKVIWLK